MKLKTTHIIAAAGSGSRFGGPLPKQFCNLCGRPLLMTTIERMRMAAPDDKIVLVLSTWMIDEWIDMCAEHGFKSPPIVEGGDSRWQSVKNAIESLPADVDIITVHDGARPMVTASIVSSVVEAVVSGRDGALPVIPVTDSIRRVDQADGSSTAVDRASLRAVQTPQAFRAAKLRAAYDRPYQPSFTDDASVMEAAGFCDIACVEGDPRNIKVTHPGDIEIAAMYLSK